MSDPLDFLDGPQEGLKETPALTPEPAKVETPAPSQDAAQPAVEAPKPTTPEPGYVPLAVVLDEREKRQALERERDELKRWREEREREPAKPRPDPILDPEGFQLELDKSRQDTVFAVTHRFAVKEHGAEIVTAAEQWLGEVCKANPALLQTVMSQPDPYEFLVRHYKRSQAFAKLGDDDPDSWFEKQFEARIKEKGYVLPERDASGKFVAAPPAPATQTPLPKPSLASAPAASGNAPKIPVGEGVAFNAVFKD